MGLEQFRSGTNFGDVFGPLQASTNINDYLKDVNGNWQYVSCTTALIPTGKAGYAKGCDLRATDSGFAYTNTGSTTSAVWTQLAAGSGGGSLSIPFSEIDAITTTGTSIGVSSTALTTGNVFSGTVATGTFTTGGVIMGNNKADDCQTGLAYTIEVFRKELQQSTTSGKVKDQKINEVIYKCGELK